MGFTIFSNQNKNYTILDNEFIIKHMSRADGNFVKVYLYILACYQNPNLISDLSICKLADVMECTEKDIIRAIKFWKKEKVLSYTEKNGELIQINLLDFKQGKETSPAEMYDDKRELVETDKIEEIADLKESDVKVADVKVADVKESDVKEIEGIVEKKEKDKELPKKQNYSASQLNAFKKDKVIKNTIERAEEIIGDVTKQYVNLIIYFICDLNFSSDMVIEAFNIAQKKDKVSPNYIEKIGIQWAKKGIKDLDEAKLENMRYSNIYRVVTRAFGINRNLATAEIEYIEKWLSFGFPDEIIEKACSKTILQKGIINFSYATTILESWFKDGVKTLDDIEKLDKEHKNKKRNNTTKSTKGKNQFQQFPQREYSKSDYANLEKQLLKG